MTDAEKDATQEILDRAKLAIVHDEQDGAELDFWWDKFSKLHSGISGPKSWEQIKRVAEAIQSDGREPEVHDIPGEYGQ